MFYLVIASLPRLPCPDKKPSQPEMKFLVHSVCSPVLDFPDIPRVLSMFRLTVECGITCGYSGASSCSQKYQVAQQAPILHQLWSRHVMGVIRA